MKRMVKVFERQTFRGTTGGTAYKTPAEMAELIGQADEIIVQVFVYYSSATLTGSSLTFQLKASSIEGKSFWDVAKSVGTAQQLTDGVSPVFSSAFSGRAGFEMNVVGDQLVVEAEVWITLIQKGV